MLGNDAIAMLTYHGDIQRVRESEKDAAGVIEKLEASYSSVKMQLETLTREHQELKSTLAASCFEVVEENIQYDNKIAEMTEQVEELSQQLRDSESEVTRAVAEHIPKDHKIADLTEQVEDLSRQLRFGEEQVTSSVFESIQNDNKIAELPRQVETLSQQQRDEDAKATSTGAEWQAAYDKVHEQAKFLEFEHKKNVENEELLSVSDAMSNVIESDQSSDAALKEGR